MLEDGVSVVHVYMVVPWGERVVTVHSGRFAKKRNGNYNVHLTYIFYSLLCCTFLPVVALVLLEVLLHCTW